METAPQRDEDDPLNDKRPGSWDRLIESLGPASILVVIENRMSKELRRRVSAEDIWQDVLLKAWRTRAAQKWFGLAAYRRYLLQSAEHRISDLVDSNATLKRRGENSAIELSLDGDSHPSHYAGPVATTTPSRAVMDREKKAAMRAALDGLPDEVREVVYLRLFEDLTMEEVAARTGLGVSAAQHRFAKGAKVYRDRLVTGRILSSTRDA